MPPTTGRLIARPEPGPVRRMIRVYLTPGLFDRLEVEAARQRKSLSLTAATLIDGSLPSEEALS